MATNIERLKTRIPEASEAELNDVLESAKDAILSRCFVSLGSATEEDKTAALTLHNEKVLEAAVIIYNMRGAEGQASHSENGVSRTFTGLDPVLAKITPRGAVV